jgi:hypothetical protein
MCRRYFCSQEIDSHYATESGATDYSRNSRRMRYFYHVQPFEITRAYKIKSPISKNRATLLNSSACFEAATLRISYVEHLISRLIALAAQPLPSVPRLRASTLFERRPPAQADSLGAAGVQKPVQVRTFHRSAVPHERRTSTTACTAVASRNDDHHILSVKDWLGVQSRSKSC